MTESALKYCAKYSKVFMSTDLSIIKHQYRQIKNGEMTDLKETMEDDDESQENEDMVVNLVALESDESDGFAMDDDDCFGFEDSDAEKADTKEEKVPTKPSLFHMIAEAPASHSYQRTPFTPTDSLVFACAMQSERTMMINDLPTGIHVKMFEDRLDLCTSMIEGPTGTPYEGCLFLFDVQVSRDYPKSAPKVKYLSFTYQKLNPNLYACGKVCLSLLGTWSGSAEEQWSAKKSSLLQLFVSIQGLILVSEPFYNEPAFHQRRGSMAVESGKYNNNVLPLVVETMTKQINNPPKCFQEEIRNHYRFHGPEIISRLESYIKAPELAPFPLLAESYNAPSLDRLKEAVMKLDEKMDGS